MGEHTQALWRPGRVWFYKPTERHDLWLGRLQKLDEIYSKHLSVIVRIASLGTKRARAWVVRIGINRDLSPRVTVSEARARSKRHEDRVIFRDPDGHEWKWSYVAELADEEVLRLRDQRPDVYKAFEKEESDRMGPPGKPGTLWDDEYDG